MDSHSHSPSLKRRVIDSGIWVIGGEFGSQFLRFSTNLVMTRLLVPEMFGVMAIANVFLVGLVMFSDLGLKQSIIQSRRGDEESYLNTVWVLQIAQGLVLFLAALGLSLGLSYAQTMGWLAASSVYADPLLPSVLGLLALTFLIRGFLSTKFASAQRRLEYRGLTVIAISSQLAGALLMVTWAFYAPSIWALVAGAVLGSIVETLATHMYLSGAGNRFQWSRDAFHEIFHFGKWIFLSSILGFLAANGDRLILGGLVASAVVGVYSIAHLLGTALDRAIAKLFSSTAFPALSEVVRERPEQLKDKYYQIRLPVDLVVLSIAGFLYSSGSLIVDLLYDERYSNAGQYLEILSLALVAQRYRLTAQAFLALGESRKLTFEILFRVLALFIGMPLAFKLGGVEAAVWSVVLSGVAGAFYLILIQHRAGFLSVSKELSILPVFLIAYVISAQFESYFVF